MSLRFVTPFVVVACLFFSTAAAAQTSLKEGEFSVQRFSPAIGPRNFVTVSGARTDGNMGFSVGLFVNYVIDPFVTPVCKTPRANPCPATRDLKIVETVVTGDLLASLTVIPRLQLG